jgi:uncharacterized protein YpmB
MTWTNTIQKKAELLTSDSKKIYKTNSMYYKIGKGEDDIGESQPVLKNPDYKSSESDSENQDIVANNEKKK